MSMLFIENGKLMFYGDEAPEIVGQLVNKSCACSSDEIVKAVEKAINSLSYPQI